MRILPFRRTRFLADESGASMLEYGLLMLFIAVAAITAAQLLGSQLQQAFNINQALGHHH